VKLRDERNETGPHDYVSSISTGSRSPRNGSTNWSGSSRSSAPASTQAARTTFRDTFISIALSAGEDPGWVAKVCGTSEEMVFRHYRSWIPGLNHDAGVKVGRILGGGGGNLPLAASPGVSSTPRVTAETQRDRLPKRVEAGGIEPRTTGSSSEPRTKKTLTYLLRLSRVRPPPGTASARPCAQGGGVRHSLGRCRAWMPSAAS